LTNKLIKSLGVELFTDRANTGFTGLALLELLVELILKDSNVKTSGGAR